MQLGGKNEREKIVLYDIGTLFLFIVFCFFILEEWSVIDFPLSVRIKALQHTVFNDQFTSPTPLYL